MDPTLSPYLLTIKHTWELRPQVILTNFLSVQSSVQSVKRDYCITKKSTIRKDRNPYGK